ncbi:hypothetical protein Bbelb_027860 [Branchiostoma belcheri]|nr:hypothetical protein Bbelb_027860 [Branchiostoma belcheri]
MFPENMTRHNKVKAGMLTPSQVILTAYGGTRIPHLGKTTITGKHGGKEVECSFYVTTTQGPAIIGLSTCQKWKIISINHEVKTSSHEIEAAMPLKDRPPIHSKKELMEMYPECFDDNVGCFKGEYHITIDPDVKPVVHPPRRVPLELRGRLKAQLEEMVEEGIISEVTQPTDWVNSIVVKEKPNGKLRICLDPKDLNNALKRDHYPTPTLEEITPHLSGARVFSKLDASNGYKFNRLPFGLKVSQDVFQREIDDAYRNCRGAIGIADDIQVYGEDDEAHDYNLHEAMERTRAAGIKLNAEKCIVKKQECKFFGMVYSKDGVKPDPAKVEAINKMKEPKDEKKLRSFLGLIQYMTAFIPNLADHTANMRELLKEDIEYKWSESHSKDFNRVKSLITKETTLQYYNRSKPVTLQVDASMKGVGAVLIQDDKPIAFASKALTPSRNEIDKKNLTKAPARLQRLLLRLQHYDYTIKYKPGKEMLLADALSRLSPHDKKEMEDMKVQIHHIVRVTTTKLEEIRQETNKEINGGIKDQELQLLAEAVTQGWPQKRNEIPPEIQGYWTIRDDISVEDGVLLAGSRIIIPKSMRPEILQKIHEGHLGMEKSKLRAKAAVYWVGLYKEIERMTQSCRTCQKYQNSQQKEEMTPTTTPSRPWKKLGADLFHLNQKWFLLVVDYYSKFQIVKNLRSLKASAVTQAVKGIFAEQGIPDEVVCDNGTQFTSEEFKCVSQEYGFKITTSSPHYPRGMDSLRDKCRQ